jgi:hypothetical protein
MGHEKRNWSWNIESPVQLHISLESWKSRRVQFWWQCVYGPHEHHVLISSSSPFLLSSFFLLFLFFLLLLLIIIIIIIFSFYYYFIAAPIPYYKACLILLLFNYALLNLVHIIYLYLSF